MAEPNNKFPVGGRFGDPNPSGPDGFDPDFADFNADSAGLPSSGINNTQTDMTLTLEPNKFPRQTGHDTIGEDVALT